MILLMTSVMIIQFSSPASNALRSSFVRSNSGVFVSVGETYDSDYDESCFTCQVAAVASKVSGTCVKTLTLFN